MADTRYEVPEMDEWHEPEEDPVLPPVPDSRDFEFTSEELEIECALADLMYRREGGQLPPKGEHPSAVAAVIQETEETEVSERIRPPLKKKVRRETRGHAPDLTHLITAEEVACMAGCSSNHIYDLCSQHGAIPHSRRGRSLTFNRADIQTWLDSFKVS